ncbi:hypothetical protein HN018_25150 (plasmid) [Lichenicola cladoniae]|uniref:Uncharacterized protein n=1 Tax=Lichenicola cladoniae TaxID=1484109 RepID=A0A6M8HY19_9PROT|nr:hypothetical protein [Lichenicola cladoniae]NPD69586.1 hypothetical protein [Acetobacteraceae bacterium]QKE93464.1 hypothetical protein HN018_25150 [Lichenicola cladoniae]
MIGVLLMLVGAVVTFVHRLVLRVPRRGQVGPATIDALTAPWDGIERRQDTDGVSV